MGVLAGPVVAATVLGEVPLPSPPPPPPPSTELTNTEEPSSVARLPKWVFASTAAASVVAGVFSAVVGGLLVSAQQEAGRVGRGTVIVNGSELVAWAQRARTYWVMLNVSLVVPLGLNVTSALFAGFTRWSD